MRILGVLGISALLTSASPPDAAWAEHAGLWVSESNLIGELARERDEYVLRSYSAPLLARLFGSPPPFGTVLMCSRRHGDRLEGTAYVFAPTAANLSSCRVLGTTFTTSTVTLIAPPAKPGPRPMSAVSSVRQTIREWRDSALATVGDLISAAKPAPPKVPEFEFPTGMPALIALGVGAVIALALGAFVLSFITLRLMAVLADARVALAERRSQLASVAPTKAAGLSGGELQGILDAAFPDIEEEQRRALARTIAAAIRDKAAS